MSEIKNDCQTGCPDEDQVVSSVPPPMESSPLSQPVPGTSASHKSPGEPLKTSKADKACAFRQEMSKLMDNLKNLHGLHFVALEQLIREWEGILEDITTMERLLARDDLEATNPILLASGILGIKRFSEVTEKYTALTKISVIIEGLFGKVKVTSMCVSVYGEMDEATSATLHDTQADWLLSMITLNLRSLNIFKELMRRTSAWNSELHRRIIEFGVPQL